MSFIKPEEKPTIYVTGFGPFGSHSENASQKVIESLSSFKSDIEEEIGVDLHTEIFDVDYQSVLKKVPFKWKTKKPKLVIHLGVSELIKDVKLEKQAFNCDYVTLDIQQYFPASKSCLTGFPPILQTDLDLEKAIAEVDSQGIFDDPIKYSISHDPGRYLCGFIYYLSLTIGCDRSLFIHVPKLNIISEDSSLSAQTLAKSIMCLIKCLYKQVQENEMADVDSNIQLVLDKLCEESPT